MSINSHTRTHSDMPRDNRHGLSHMTEVDIMNSPDLFIATFEQQLARIVGRLTTLRPIICSGSHLAWRVFFVGLNPASLMQLNF